jgi:hypothetical protein
MLVLDLSHPLMPVVAFGILGCLIGLGFIVLIRLTTGKRR